MNCLFCKIVNKEIEAKKIYEDDLVIAILDIHPNCDGHTLIIPKKHYEDFTKLPVDLLEHLNKVAYKLGKSLMKKLNSLGLSLIVNYGSNQEIKHFHLHILPTKKGTCLSVEEIYEIITK